MEETGIAAAAPLMEEDVGDEEFMRRAIEN